MGEHPGHKRCGRAVAGQHTFALETKELYYILKACDGQTLGERWDDRRAMLQALGDGQRPSPTGQRGGPSRSSRQELAKQGR
eukprot:1915996-Amphidinium_carterae.1